MQGTVVAFYKRFLESPNFAAWFERQREAAWAWQETEWTAAAAVRGEGADLSGLDEVQVSAILTFSLLSLPRHSSASWLWRGSHHVPDVSRAYSQLTLESRLRR